MRRGLGKGLSPQLFSVADQRSDGSSGFFSPSRVCIESGQNEVSHVILKEVSSLSLSLFKLNIFLELKSSSVIKRGDPLPFLLFRSTYTHTCINTYTHIRVAVIPPIRSLDSTENMEG